MQTTPAPPRILIVIGTRPEAIKLFPVIQALQRRAARTVMTCVTGQHPAMVAPVLAMAGIRPDIMLSVMRPGQSLDALTARLIEALGDTLDRVRPDLVVVQGDTASAAMAAQAAMFRCIPVAHVEAGLRSGSIADPCPEEGFRRIISAIAALHFAPTPAAAAALTREHVDGTVHMTGNTVIDALVATRGQLANAPGLAAEVRPILDRFAGRHLIFTTAHRRESIPAIGAIADALAHIAARPDAAILLPLHPNPAVADTLRAVLGGHPNIALTGPLDYPNAVAALSACHVVLTDSGGLQEEAPFLGKPVLVMRDSTERPEGVAAGMARLVGADADRIVAATAELLDHRAAWEVMARPCSLYGDGHAAIRIADLIAARFG